MTDQTSLTVVFFKHSFSASHMAASNFLGAVEHIPHNSCEYVDARSSYIESPMDVECFDGTWIAFGSDVVNKFSPKS